jgi:hypothetical protein
MKHRVFISYAGAQKAYADSICDQLEAGGIRCWIAHRDISPGTDWVDRIPEAVEHAELVLALLSRDALVSGWVDRELNWAVTHERPLLPVVFGDVQPSPRLDFLFGTIQRTPLPNEPSETDLTRLVATVRGVLADREPALNHVSEAQPAEAPRPEDPFVHRVTVARPAYFVLLLDHSFTMNQLIAEGGVRKRDAVADVVNDLLYTLLKTSRRPDGYRHYFDVSVFGYGLGSQGDAVVSRLPEGRERMAVGELDGAWLSVAEVERVQKLAGGGTTKVPVKQPIWVESLFSRGKTVTAAAFWRAGTLVESWIAEHPESLPPVVLNVSDGGWTGEDPMNAVRALQEQATELGPTLVFNCQLGGGESTGRRGQLLFPSEIPGDYGRRTKELFMLSSLLPDSMREEARARGVDVRPDARGLVYNAPVSRLVDFLQVGTQTLT